MNINDIIIKGKVTKDAVSNASESDILRLTEDTIKRMVSRKGSIGYYKNRKMFNFDHISNGWNAWAKSLELYNGKLFINFYVQYSNTDTDECEFVSKFIGNGDFRGTISHTDRYGNSQTAYYRFDTHDKAKVLKAICLEYLSRCK